MPQVVLQVITCVKQRLQSSLEWLACLIKVSIERPVVLHPCLVYNAYIASLDSSY